MKGTVREIPLWNGKVVGDTLYVAQKYNNTGRYGISMIEITRIEEKLTPKGKVSGVYFYGKPINYTLGDGSKEEYQFDVTEWSKDPVKAVSRALNGYLANVLEGNSKPEDRLLAACFGENLSQVGMEQIAGMIDVLKQFHGLFAKTFAWKDEKVQKVTVEEGK